MMPDAQFGEKMPDELKVMKGERRAGQGHSCTRFAVRTTICQPRLRISLGEMDRKKRGEKGTEESQMRGVSSCPTGLTVFGLKINKYQQSTVDTDQSASCNSFKPNSPMFQLRMINRSQRDTRNGKLEDEVGRTMTGRPWPA
jgi:hypothetical protein